MVKVTTPRGFWQWLVYFSPAIINWLAIFFGPRIQFALFGNPHNEGAVWAWAAWGIYSLMFGAVLCLGLGGWLARNSDTYQDIAVGVVLYGLGFVIVNAAVAFGGCAAVAAF